MSKHPALLLSLVAVALGVAACGGSSGTSSSAASAGTGASSSASAAAGTSSGAGTGTSSSAKTATSSSAAAGASGASSHLTLMAMANGQLMFDKKSLAAAAGTVTIAFTNQSPEQHNLTTQKGTDGAVVGATPTFDGGTKTLTVKLTAGTYTFYCSVPGHRMAGMQGTLTVS